MRNALTVGSLFAGIGGFDLGLTRAGMRSVWQCEIDPYAQRVLEKHWPAVLRVPDIRDVGAGTVPRVDVICGGFPCQGISWAGLGLGLDDERSGLWSEMLRVIRELRPRWVVVENVAALLARGLDVVLGGLAACGYDAEWDCIPASAVGAPHRRDRVWLVAYPTRDLCSGAATSGAERERTRAGGQRGETADVADADGARSQGHRRPDEGPRELAAAESRGARGTGEVADTDQERRGRRAGEQRPGRRGEPADGGGGLAEPGFCRVPDGLSEGLDGGHWSAGEWPGVPRVAVGVPQRVDRLRALGNALVPQIAEWLGCRIIDYERGADAL